MSLFAQAVTSVLPLLIMMGFGFTIAKKPWFGKTGEDFLSKFCMRVAIPCYMIINVSTTCPTRADLLDLLKLFPVPFAAIFLLLGLALLMVRILKVDKGIHGVFINVMTFSNTVIIGFPVTISLFGEASTPIAMSYYVANTVMFWSIGAYLLRKDGGMKSKLISAEGLKKLASPPLMGFGLGVLLVLAGINLPTWLFSPLQQIGRTATPLAMVMTGSVLRHMDLKQVKPSKELVVLLLSRFVLSPAILLCIMMNLPLSDMAKQVYLIMTVMPAMTQLGIVAKEARADYEFAAMTIAVTTVISMVLIPCYIMLISFLMA
ncbi:MAG: AEC family transporter [Firmicutes bacterium]|nr:AEC family transporter [Bacillota bacterium]